MEATQEQIDEQVKDAIILVRSMAAKWSKVGQGIPNYEDYESAGNEVIAESLKTFDSSRGVTFAAYCHRALVWKFTQETKRLMTGGLAWTGACRKRITDLMIKEKFNDAEYEEFLRSVESRETNHEDYIDFIDAKEELKAGMTPEERGVFEAIVQVAPQWLLNADYAKEAGLTYNEVKYIKEQARRKAKENAGRIRFGA